MGKQLIIAVSREFGSGGHEIGGYSCKNLIFRFMTTIF